MSQSRPVLRAAAAFAIAFLITAAANAHVVSGDTTRPPVGAESLLDFLDVGIPMMIAGVLFTVGLLRLRQRRSPSTASLHARPLLFAAGWLMAAVCLLSPVDTWAARLFSVHMIQHELLMLVAAPLLVLSKPLPTMLWAFGQGARQWLGRVTHVIGHSRAWRLIASPPGAWLLHALALWAWHAPALFDASLANRGVHTLQHLSFFVTALLFWNALFVVPQQRSGVAVLYLFTTTVHTSVLGALITFASDPWYASYLERSALYGLSALEDQQLGGLIMWVPCSLVYLAAALILLGRWLDVSRGAVVDGAGR